MTQVIVMILKKQQQQQQQQVTPRKCPHRNKFAAALWVWKLEQIR